MKLKRKLRKQKEKQELVSKALDYKEFSTQKNEKTKVFSMMALSNLCKHYRNYFNIPNITDENLVNGDTKIPVLTERNTLWCTFKLEDIIQRTFRAVSRLIQEYEYEDLQNPNQRKIKDFKNEFVIVEFSKMYQKELMELKFRFGKYLKSNYKETEKALKEMIVLFAYYEIFKKQIQDKLNDFSKNNRMYMKTFITKTDRKFEEIKDVIIEGGEPDFKKDMLELLKFEEAGIKIKWVGYSRKTALKMKTSRNKLKIAEV